MCYSGIAHGPGPPHLPHIPGGNPPLLPAASDETANTLIARAVSVEPHLGHSASSGAPIVLTSFSNLFSHFLQLYS